LPVATSSTLPPEIDPSLFAILGASDDPNPSGKHPNSFLMGANLTSSHIILAEKMVHAVTVVITDITAVTGMAFGLNPGIGVVREHEKGSNPSAFSS